MIINACRPYAWRDAFVAAVKPSEEMARRAKEKFGWLLDCRHGARAPCAPRRGEGSGEGAPRSARLPGLERLGKKVDPCRHRTTLEETTMLNRRHLLRTGAATVAAAMIARMPRAFAATYDLVIKGGRVIDPSLGLDAVRDVAIAKGRIAAVGEQHCGDAAETIDAGGKLVVPGLIDIHTHAGRSQGRARACAAGRRDRLGRRRLGRRRQHRPDRRRRAGRAADRPRAGQHRAHRRPLAGRRAARTSTAATSPWRKARSRATATWWSASRRACRRASPGRTISRRCGAPRKRPRRSGCR